MRNNELGRLAVIAETRFQRPDADPTETLFGRHAGRPSTITKRQSAAAFRKMSAS